MTEKPVETIPTERDLRLLNRQFIQYTREFNEIQPKLNIDESRKIFAKTEKYYVTYCENAERFKNSLNIDDQEKIEETIDKIALITQQFEILKTSLTEFEKDCQRQQVMLGEDLRQTSKKNSAVRSVSSHRTLSSIHSSKLYDYEGLTHQEKVLVAESKLKAATLEFELAKKLAASRKRSVQVTNLNNSKPENVIPPVDNSVQDIFSQNDGLLSSSNIGDDYLAGKILIESGKKVQFDGNPKDCIAFRQGIERVISIHGKRYGLIYDILQSRCTEKAASAIRFCDRIQDSELAMNTALERLKRYFGDDTAIIDAHIRNITRDEMIKWTVDGFQFFLNELEDIKVLLNNKSHTAMINSPGVMKGIITRLPKRSRDELAKRLCQVNEHLPDFEYLLKFVEGQLRLVSHPVMNIVKDSKSNETNLNWKSKAERPFVRKVINAVINNARSHMHNVFLGDVVQHQIIILFGDVTNSKN